MRKFIFILSALILLFGCASQKPQSFNPVSDPKWAFFDIREDIDYDEAWQTINSILVKHYSLDLINKEIGYVRTSWRYGYNEEYQGKYRSMVEIKFVPDHTQLKMRTISHYKKETYWVQGTDSKLISSLKSDVLGRLGRTSR